MNDESPKPKGHAKEWDAAALALLLGSDDYPEADKFWRSHVAPAYQGMLNHDGFTFDVRDQMFVKPNGRRVAKDDTAKLALLFLLSVSFLIEVETEKMIAGELFLPKWQEFMASTVKNAYLCEAALAVGGFANLTLEDIEVVQGDVGVSGLADSLERLQTFAIGVEQGEVRADTNDYVLYRAGLYLTPARNIFESVRVNSYVRAVDDKGELLWKSYRNILGMAEEHCSSDARSEGCLEVTAAGWQPIGYLPDIGERRCGCGCKCSWEFSARSKEELDS